MEDTLLPITPTNARVLSSSNSSCNSKSNDSSFLDDINRRPTFSPDFYVLDTEIRKQILTKRLTEELTAKLTEELTAKLTEELTTKLTEELTTKLTEELTEKLTEEITEKLTEALTEKVCNVMKQHMLDTLSSISIKPQPVPKKCCIIS